VSWLRGIYRGERPYNQIVWCDMETWHQRRVWHAIVILRPMSYVD